MTSYLFETGQAQVLALNNIYEFLAYKYFFKKHGHADLIEFLLESKDDT